MFTCLTLRPEHTEVAASNCCFNAVSSAEEAGPPSSTLVAAQIVSVQKRRMALKAWTLKRICTGWA